MTKKKTKTKQKLPISEQIKELIRSSELSRYRMSKETGISQSTLSEFLSGNRSLSLANIDKLGRLLDLELVSRNTTPKKLKGRIDGKSSKTVEGE